MLSRTKINTDYSIIVVTVTLEGDNKVKRKTRLVFDTGATYVMISWDVAYKLGLRPELARETVNISTASGRVQVPLVNLKAVSFLGKKSRSVKAVIHDLPEGANIDGLLGLSFLKNFEININFKKGYLEIK